MVGKGCLRSPEVRAWFERVFRGAMTPVQERAWPVVASGAHALLIAPTGTGKTLAAVLPLIDQLAALTIDDLRQTGLRCVYIAPLRSLAYDLARNLTAAIGEMDWSADAPIRVSVRTGDTRASERRKTRERPPHVLITTPESLALLLSQPAWRNNWREVQAVIVDEVHDLVPTKRGADLTISLERLGSASAREPQRIGLSATCRPAEVVAGFLGGVGRSVEIIEVPQDSDNARLELRIESLIGDDEATWRPLAYQRLVRRVRQALGENRTTVVFANTRALTEKLTHDLARPRRGSGDETVPSTAAHHSALDAARRREVEQRLKCGELRGVVTSTSLELGIDIGSADLTIMIGPPTSVTRCLQRVGRSGHRLGALRRGLLLAATPAEIVASLSVVEAARRGDLEPIAPVRAPLDVLCQQVLGIACAGEASADETYELVRRASPFSTLDRSDFDDCLAYLAGQPSGSDPNGGWTSPRLWKQGDLFGVRSRRVPRWLWTNIGTITSEETVRVWNGGTCIGTIESAYADRLQPGDRFVLDGRSLQLVKRQSESIKVQQVDGPPNIPRWTSDRLAMTPQLACEVASLRRQIEQAVLAAGWPGVRDWAAERGLDASSASVLFELVEAQSRAGAMPRPGGVLVEHHIGNSGSVYTFHAALGRAGCEALARAVSARMGRVAGCNMGLAIADLGWSIQLPVEHSFSLASLSLMLSSERLEVDTLLGLDRGELLPRQFRRVASTALMILRNPDGKRTRVGGAHWVEQRLYPLLVSVCPDHPLLRETRRAVLEDVLDMPTARAFLAVSPLVELSTLNEASPYARAWIDPVSQEALAFESPTQALRRLHERLCGVAS